MRGVVTPVAAWDLFASYGHGFHSNDARAAVSEPERVRLPEHPVRRGATVVLRADKLVAPSRLVDHLTTIAKRRKTTGVELAGDLFDLAAIHPQGWDLG